MKRKIEKIILSTLGILLIFTFGVNSEEAGTVTSISKCQGTTWDNYEECIVWNYKNGTLHIEHLNTMYNCCLNDLKLSIESSKNKIVIQSEEKYTENGPCD